MTKILICVLIAFSLIAIIYAGPIPDEFKEVAPGIRETCMKESGVEQAMVEKAAAGEFIEDDKLKCYMKCVFDQFRLVSKKGFNFDAMLGLSPPKMKDTAIKAIAACRDTKWKENDLCDLSYNLMTCFYETAPDEYFII